jgi:hypothetical protein
MMRRHELDPVSLTFGFAFTGLGLLFLVGQADQALRLRWIWPLLLLALGAGILLDLARTRRDGTAVPAADTDADPTHAPEAGPYRDPDAVTEDPVTDPVPRTEERAPDPVDDHEHPR